MMAPRLVLVIAAVVITEADLGLPFRGLAWIATLLSLNIARSLGGPSGMYRVPQSTLPAPFSITIHLQPVTCRGQVSLRL